MSLCCLVCGSPTEHFFSKNYAQTNFADLMADIGSVSYNKCVFCGFVFSITHQGLSYERWERLNTEYHHAAEKNLDILPRSGKPPYLEQAMMIAILHKYLMIDMSNAIDYAAGYGSLSKILSTYFSLTLPIYDQYVTSFDPDTIYVNDPSSSTFSTVINSAMLEHVVDRQGMNRVNQLVDDNGCLILHSVICERIPQDPNWFYLDPPVHTAFFTNRALSLLMQQWGYQSSVYCPQAKSWVLFKTPDSSFEKKIADINAELKKCWFIYNKDGFVDYWKGF